MISVSDPRWAWVMDPKRSFSSLSAYRGNRQVSDLPFRNWTDSGVLPQNDGVNQIFLRELDPLGSGEYVYRMRIGKDRAAGSTYLTNTWRSEVSNTLQTPVWGIEYWAACGVMLGDDWAPGSPTCTIFELHVPSPQPNPVGISPFGVMCGGGNFIAAVRYNAGVPTTANDHTLGAQVTHPATRGVWHQFVLNFKLGADNTANFMRIWVKTGANPVTQIMNYTGRIGYDANTSARYNYSKHGLYSWTYPWPSSSTSRTIWSQGFHLITAAGSPSITLEDMFDVLSAVVVEPEPPEYLLWEDVTFPSVARFSPILDGSYDAWGPSSDPQISGVVFTNNPTQVIVNSTAQFSAHAVGNGAYDPSVTYSVESGSGSIDSSGLYTAPASTGTVTIRATSVANPLIYDESTLSVISAAPPNIPVILPITDSPVSVMITGTGATGASIDLTINGVEIPNASTVTNGEWTYTFMDVVGDYAVSARQTLEDGVSDWSAEASFSILPGVITTSVETVWTFNGVSFFHQSLDYVIKTGSNVIIAQGTATTDANGLLSVDVPIDYQGQKVVVQVENVGVDGSPLNRVHGTQVVIV